MLNIYLFIHNNADEPRTLTITFVVIIMEHAGKFADDNFCLVLQ